MLKLLNQEKFVEHSGCDSEAAARHYTEWMYSAFQDQLIHISSRYSSFVAALQDFLDSDLPNIKDHND